MITYPPKILITQRIHTSVQHRLAEYGELEMNDGLQPWPRSEIQRRVAQATAIMGFMTDQIDHSLLRSAPNLRIVACALKGYDNFDVDACTQRGVWVSIVPDLLTEPTAELAIGLAIALGRHIRHGDAYVRSGEFAGWRPHFYGVGLQGCTAAVVGLGQVGRAIVKRLAGFGCNRIVGVDPQACVENVEAVSLNAAMTQADFLFVAAPLTASTHHMIGAAELSNSKVGQLIVNVGRGSVVDETAILLAMQTARIGGYAADVFGCEDWQLPQRPRTVSAQLLAQPNTIFTPHIGSAVHHVRKAIEQSASDNIIAVLEGRAPPNAINTPHALTA